MSYTYKMPPIPTLPIATSTTSMSSATAAATNNSSLNSHATFAAGSTAEYYHHHCQPQQQLQQPINSNSMSMQTTTHAMSPSSVLSNGINNHNSNNTTQVLFDEFHLPLLVSSPPKEPFTYDASIQFFHCSPSNSYAFQTFSLQITMESNPYFLYFCDVTENDFVTLKKEQKISVDFATFPNEIRRLLNMCKKPMVPANAAQESSRMFANEPSSSVNLSPSRYNSSAENESTSSAPQYECILELNPASTCVLRIVYQSPFRAIDYLTLKIRPATDAQLKKHLVDCLLQERNAHKIALQRSEMLERECKEGERRQREHEIELKDLHTKAEERAAQVWKVNSAQRDEELSRHKNEVAHIRENFDQKIMQLQEGTQQREETLMRQLKSTQQSVQDLTTSKHAFAMELSQRSATLDGLRKDHDALRIERDELKQRNEKLEAEKESERSEKIRLEKRLTALEQAETDNKLMTTRIDSLMESEKSQRSHIETTLAAVQTTRDQLQQKLDNCLAEMEKGNEVIAKLQTRLAKETERAQRRRSVLQKQEEVIAQLQETLQKKDQELSQITRELEKVRMEEAKWKEKFSSLEKANADTMQQLRDCERTIIYLNQKENEKNTSNLPASNSYAFPRSSYNPSSANNTASFSASSLKSNNLPTFTTPLSSNSTGRSEPNSYDDALKKISPITRQALGLSAYPTGSPSLSSTITSSLFTPTSASTTMASNSFTPIKRMDHDHPSNNSATFEKSSYSAIKPSSFSTPLPRGNETHSRWNEKPVLPSQPVLPLRS